MAELEVNIFNFYYSRNHNPCLGHKVAIDTGGEIKPCLWADDSLGILGKNSLKDLVGSRAFDKYWRLTKNDIEECKDCELRAACRDCRVAAGISSGAINEKPPYCSYNPYSGEFL